jgi:lipoprotein-anchoring transpeptidase ErfK/SrfK
VIRIDGEDVSASATRTPSGYTLPMPELADGPHRVTVDVSSSDLIDDTASYSWTFTSDGTAPALTATTGAGWTTSAKINGVSEPGATVTATWQDGEVATTADEAGRFQLVPGVADGVVPLTLIAADTAGNETRARHTMRVDTGRPTVRLGGIDGWVTDTDRPKVYAFVDSASPTKIVAKVNGQDAKVTPMSIGYTIETSKLPQGTSEVELFITNATGKTATRTKEINVDSTEKLTSELTLAPGAKGDDVANLTRRLRLAKMWKGKLSWEYNAKVERAVRAYQRKEGLPEDGIARPALISATGGKIVVIQSKFVLNLYLEGKFFKQYPIAVGMPAYPTPTGSFVVTEKIENPTWTPPNSPWAAGLEPIPPGASNPLGTRWIGTSAYLVGIHGTPQGWSIGTAASHGCVRMHISDVEELFTHVAVGMPVEIKS